MEQYIQGASRNNALSFQNPKSMTAFDQAEADPPVGFDCNICLDPVQDPVVTLCGHLYCWPCIYRWITFQDSTSQNPDLQNPQCPVCKSEVSEKTLIPLYGRGQTTTTTSKSEPSPKIPQRPASPRCWNNTIIPNPFQQLHNRGYNPAPPSPPGYSTYTVSPTTHLADPMIGVFGEMVYARIFGNSDSTLYTYPNSYHLAGSSSPRLRRHAMLIDKSLSRVCFFLFCCVILCLLLF